MGGRGGASVMSAKGGGYTGLSVTTKDGETTRYYFTSNSGQNYYQRGIGGSPEPTPLNMSAEEFRDRVEKSGASVRTVSSTERSVDEKAYKEERAAMQRLLDMADRQDKTMKRVTRMERVGNRATRRR